MDIYGAETTVKRLLEFVKSLAKRDTRMYKPSRDRLRELASTCEQVVEVISTILQEGALESVDDVEFNSSSDPEIVAALSRMQSQISQLQSFIVPGTPVVPAVKSDISCATRKIVISDYRTTLNDAANIKSCYPAVNEISAALWKWFRTRFIDRQNVATDFRYNIRRLPDWIRDIVILYGHAIETKTADSFLSMLNEWCDALMYAESRDRYAVPYCIYEFDKNPSGQLLTLTSVVLWDMLMDHRLNNISSESRNSDLYLDPYAIYNLCDSIAPEVLDNYRSYRSDESIRSQFILIRAEESR